MKSIIQETKECFLCRLEADQKGYYGPMPEDGLQEHHIFPGTANRKQSEKHGLKVWLCPNHHTGPKGVHLNRVLSLSLMGIAQRKFEERHSREEFRKVFGKSWLD